MTTPASPFGPEDAVEVIGPAPSPRAVRAVLFDFDGTLSLLRGGWAGLMQEQFVAELRRAGDVSPEADLAGRVRAGILSNNGRPTLWQMRFLAEEVLARGATPRTPEDYLADFLDRLLAVVSERRSALERGNARAEEFTVPGALPFLAHLRGLGLPLVLASGTDRRHVEAEAALLGIAPYFGPRLHAPVDEDPHFSKRAVIEAFLTETGIAGGDLLAFGDGAVETAEVKRVGGLAVGVACDEEAPGLLDAGKREALVRAGADVIVPDYRAAQRLLAWLTDAQPS